MRHDDRDEERSRCGLCGKILCPYGSISVAQVGERCYRCFNKELAERLGVDFDNTPIAPIVVTDVDGVRHRFEIRSMMVPTGHAMYAREITKRDARGGYRFEILGDFETDARDLLKLLRERIGQGLSVRHVHETEHGWQLTQARRLSGVIEWDPETEGALPLLIVDGRTFTWGSDRPHADDVRGLHAERGRGGHRRGRRRPACRWSTRDPGLGSVGTRRTCAGDQPRSLESTDCEVGKYRRSTGDAAGTVDLMLTFVEAGTEQAADLGYGDEAYFNALQIRLDAVAKEFDTWSTDVRPKVRARLARIQVRARDVGWGFSDAVDEVVHALDARAARVRQDTLNRR